jgi:CO/xanthine dehydrogenase Mo-binding subunit
MRPEPVWLVFAALAVAVGCAGVPASPARRRVEEQRLAMGSLLHLTAWTSDEAATRAAFERADHVVSLDIVNNRVVVNAMEPRAARASVDPSENVFELSSGSQGVHFLQGVLAEAIFNVPRSELGEAGPVGVCGAAERWLCGRFVLQSAGAPRPRPNFH